MYKRLELHNHTTESDSSLTCHALLDYMESDHADAFALTDHNTISGHSKMKKLLDEGTYHTQCIYGMEYTTYYGHILCFNLNEYVPWDSINYHKPELLFKAVKEKGGIAGIAHPFSYGAPFSKGCRFEMTVTDYRFVDFIEIFNNPEPLHEVNKKGLLWWEALILKGNRLAATCGMDLHGTWDMAGQYATFLIGAPNGDIAEELAAAIHTGQTWVSKGPLLCCGLLPASDTKEAQLFVHIEWTGKPGYRQAMDQNYILTLTTQSGIFAYPLNPSAPRSVALKELALPPDETGIVIPKLYENEAVIENLICVAPVLYVG